MKNKKEIKVFLGADHAGFEMKEKVKKFLEEKGFNYVDLSPRYKKDDDYTEHALKVGKEVAKEDRYRGILICGTGTGMSIAANKVKGIRAVAAYDSYSAKKSREDNDANVLGLRGREFPFKKIKKIIEIWLRTDFTGNSRHKKRLNKISKYES